MMTKNRQNISAGKLPVYLQIAEQIAREISAGLLIDGQRLPPERQLALDYGVAVRTLRKSLARLTQMGLLIRKHGSGNYIRKNENSSSIYSFFRLELPPGGGFPSAHIIDVNSLKKPAGLPTFGGSDQGLRFRRQRFLNNIPVAAEEIWLDCSCAGHIQPAQISQSLYKFYKERLGIWIIRAEDWVGVSPLPDWADGLLSLEAGAVCGYIERFGWSQSGEKIEYSRTWYDAQAARYVARLK
jgi:GntR family transcriptional regulator